jgi:filamentous hemagglutinin family protein
MNKNLHRIIFNAKRGQRMAVAETATAQGKTAGGEAGSSRHPVFAAVVTAALAACAYAAIAFFALAEAQVRADATAPGNQRATVLAAPNGVPLINIQTPNAAGVSRNTYSQFDVQRNGVILNNSRTAVQTQLGGFVGGNPWMNAPASVILNEVNSSNPSLLRGYVEVAGQRASVIIANPSGIQVDGGGVYQRQPSYPDHRHTRLQQRRRHRQLPCAGRHGQHHRAGPGCQHGRLPRFLRGPWRSMPAFLPISCRSPPAPTPSAQPTPTARHRLPEPAPGRLSRSTRACCPACTSIPSPSRAPKTAWTSSTRATSASRPTCPAPGQRRLRPTTGTIQAQGNLRRSNAERQRPATAARSAPRQTLTLGSCPLRSTTARAA